MYWEISEGMYLPRTPESEETEDAARFLNVLRSQPQQTTRQTQSPILVQASYA